MKLLFQLIVGIQVVLGLDLNADLAELNLEELDVWTKSVEHLLDAYPDSLVNADASMFQRSSRVRLGSLYIFQYLALLSPLKWP